MHKQLSLWAGAALVACAVFVAPSTACGAQAYGVTTSNVLFTFDTATPGTISNGLAISGFASANENIVGIDFRPATGQLYAMGSFGQLYTVNTSTAVLTAVGSATTIDGTSFGFDFNPTLDSIRVVSNTNKNYVVNPNTGAQLAATDLFFPIGDPAFGVDPNVVGIAYTNTLGGPPTQLYAIDAGIDVLATLANDTGVLGTVGGLATVNTGSLVGFDVFSPSAGVNFAYATLTPTGNSVSNLYTINLATGAASLVGQINGGTLVTDIAVVPVPEPTAFAAIGLAGAALMGRRRSWRR
jgi:hypothetical protein